MTGPRPRSLAALAILLLGPIGCGDEASPSSPSSDAGAGLDAEPDAGPADPFCRGRPLLPFCEDFDERPLPGAFAELLQAPGASVALASDPAAPSPPSAVTFMLPAGETSAWLRTARAARNARVEAFFFVRVETLGADLELAAFEDASGYRLAVGVAADGTVRLIDTASPSPIHASPLKLAPGTWTSVRWDGRFVDGVFAARLRIGAATAFEREPVGLAAADVELAFALGAAKTAGPETRAMFDSVTFATNPPP